MDQVLPVGGDEGAVVGRQPHGLGLLVTQAVGHVQPHHVARVGLVQRHQVELRARRRRRSSVRTTQLLLSASETHVHILSCSSFQISPLTR